MASFHEVRLPIDLAFGSIGGPERRTEIVVLGSQREERNQRWAHARRRFDIGFGLRGLADLETVIAFFEERRGRFHGFRFRDPLDWRSAPAGSALAPTDQNLGHGDGERRAFQLRKRYGGGFDPYHRPIAKPVAGTVRVAVDGVEAGLDDFDVDATTGIVTFDPGATPEEDAQVTAGFEFDCPVRFDVDRLEVSLAAFAAGTAPSIPIVEILP